MANENLCRPDSYKKTKGGKSEEEIAALTEFDLKSILNIGWKERTKSFVPALFFSPIWSLLIPFLFAVYHSAGLRIAKKEFRISSIFTGLKSSPVSIFLTGFMSRMIPLAVYFAVVFIAFVSADSLDADTTNSDTLQYISYSLIFLLIAVVYLFFDSRFIAAFPSVIDKGMILWRHLSFQEKGEARLHELDGIASGYGFYSAADRFYILRSRYSFYGAAWCID